MEKCAEYKVVIGNISSLTKEVNGLLQNGWQPWGSPQMDGEAPYTLIQAMVRYADETKKHLTVPPHN